MCRGTGEACVRRRGWRQRCGGGGDGEHTVEAALRHDIQATCAQRLQQAGVVADIAVATHQILAYCACASQPASQSVSQQVAHSSVLSQF
jgi:hypothetical protein